MSILLLNFYYQPNGETFSYDISSLSTIDEIREIVILKLFLKKQPGDIGFVKWSDSEDSQKFLNFEGLKEAASNSQSVEVVKSPLFSFQTLIDCYQSNRVNETEQMIKDVCKYANDDEMAVAVSSTPNGMETLFKIGGNNWAKKSDIWKLIFAVFSNSSYQLTDEDINILYTKFKDINAPIQVIQTMDAYVSSTEEEIKMTIIPDLVRISALRLKEHTDAPYMVSLLNNFASKLKNSAPQILSSFYDVHTFKLMYSQLQNVEESSFDDYRNHLIATQNFIIENTFSSKVSVPYNPENKDHSDLLTSLKELYKDSRGFLCTTDDFKYFDSKHGGMFLADALMYLNHRPTGQNFEDTLPNIIQFNSSAKPNERIPVLVAGYYSIEAMKYLIAKIETEALAPDSKIAQNLLKPLFIEPEPANDLFCALFAVFFGNWKNMNGNIDIVENIFNFTRHQIDIILTKPTVRSLQFFKDYVKNFPNYHEESHNWLKMDINKIIDETIHAHPSTLKEVSDNLHETIVKIISKSFIQHLKSNPIAVIKIHKNKDKRFLVLRLNEEFAFTVEEYKTDNERIEALVFQISNFVGLFTTIADIKKNSASLDEALRKKLTSHSVLLKFKQPNKEILFDCNPENPSVQILHDSLLHLSRKEMNSKHFKSYYQKLKYILLKVQLFEFEGTTIPKDIPQIPALPEDIEAAFDE